MANTRDKVNNSSNVNSSCTVLWFTAPLTHRVRASTHQICSCRYEVRQSSGYYKRLRDVPVGPRTGRWKAQMLHGSRVIATLHRLHSKHKLPLPLALASFVFDLGWIHRRPVGRALVLFPFTWTQIKMLRTVFFSELAD